jgi:RHS repeat-associated protein
MVGIEKQGEPDNRFQYNGKEKQEDFSLNLIDFGNRMQDPQLGRFHVIDRFAEKYYDWTGYQYGGNNPVKFVDVNGDSLILSGEENVLLEFERMTNEGLGGFYIFSTDRKTGLSTLQATDKKGEMTEEQQAFYNSINSATSLEVGKVEIGLEENSPVFVGSFYGKLIDMADIKAVEGKSNLFTAQGLIAHEVAEQASAQLNPIKDVFGNLIFDEHHDKFGIPAENATNGSVRGMAQDDVKGITKIEHKGLTFFAEDKSIFIKYSNKAETHFIRIDVEKNNITNITVKPLKK